MKEIDFYLEPSPELTKPFYRMLKLPKDSWKEGGFDNLVDSLQEIEHDRAERYARRIAKLELRIYELEKTVENRTFLAAGLGALAVDIALRPWYKKYLFKK